MKYPVLLPSLMLVTIASAAAQSVLTDDQAVSKLQTAFYEAYAKGDSHSIDRLLAKDYTHNDLRGGFKDRAAYMDYIDSVAGAIKSGAVKIDSSGIDDLRVRTYGDIAVATGGWSARCSKGANQDTEQFRFTYVWVKGAGGWQAVAGQVTPVAPK